MAFKLSPRVAETSTTTGTGALTLAGAKTQAYRAFSAFMSNGDTTWYAACNRSTPSEWEAGIGTWGTGGILTRTTVIESSNANAAVNFSAGIKDVICDLPAAKALLLDLDLDTTLAANSDSKIASQKATKAYVDAAVTGLLDFKGPLDASANPNYPAALKGDAYLVTVAGKVGGASGESVEVGDVVAASADNAGGTEAAVGTSWFVLEHSLVGGAQAAWTFTALDADANPTLAVNNFHFGSIAGYSADRTATLPAVAAVGDRIAICVTTGDDAFELLITAAAGDTLNGIAGGTEWSRLFISGEIVILRCVVENATWIVEYDGRKSCQCLLEEAVATVIAHNTEVKISLDTEVFDVGDIGDPTTNNRINIRRAGKYIVAYRIGISALAVNTLVLAEVWKNGAGYLDDQTQSISRAGTGYASGPAAAFPLAAGDYLELYGYWVVASGSGNKSTEVGIGARPLMSVVEVL